MGLTANRAVRLISEIMGVDVTPVEEWWGDVPFPFVKIILESDFPGEVAKLLGVDLPKGAEDVEVAGAAAALADRLDEGAEEAAENDAEEGAEQ